jgi:hypothetical protein
LRASGSLAKGKLAPEHPIYQNLTAFVADQTAVELANANDGLIPSLDVELPTQTYVRFLCHFRETSGVIFGLALLDSSRFEFAVGYDAFDDLAQRLELPEKAQKVMDVFGKGFPFLFT